MSKTYLIVGTGKSGIAATELLQRMGETPILFDGNEDADFEKIKAEHPELASVMMCKGQVSEELLQKIDIVVLSPGVPTDIPMVEEFRAHNLPIWGEVELAYELGKGQVVGITGTNGKTTTTALTGEIMKEHFKSVFVVGNIGIPYTSIADKTLEESVSVAEISFSAFFSARILRSISTRIVSRIRPSPAVTAQECSRTNSKNVGFASSVM